MNTLIFYVDMSKLIWKIMRIRKQKSVKQTCFPWIILLNFLLHTKESIEWSSEIEKLFLAIYFMMENSQANEYREF